MRYIEVPRLLNGGKSAKIPGIEVLEREKLLYFAVLQVVHVYVNSICIEK